VAITIEVESQTTQYLIVENMARHIFANPRLWKANTCGVGSILLHYLWHLVIGLHNLDATKFEQLSA
jgi:hypothetical protein